MGKYLSGVNKKELVFELFFAMNKRIEVSQVLDFQEIERNVR